MADDAPTPPASTTPTPMPTAVPAVPTPKAPESFSREYVTELREENKGWRLKADEQAQRARSAEEAAKLARSEADARIAAAGAEAEAAKNAAVSAANQRVIAAELRTHALRAGMVDLDGLKLADLGTVRLTATGEVEGAEALMTALKAAKPWLFGAHTPGAANPAAPPTPKPTTAKRATELSDDEYRAALARIDSGQGAPR